MGALIGRGLLAFIAAMLCAFILAILGSYFAPGAMACPQGGCDLADELSLVAAFAIIFGYIGFFLAIIMVIPFLVVFVVLTRMGWAKAPVFALCGVAFALFFVAFGPPLGDAPLGDTQAETFRANITSGVGIAALVIGALSGLAAWVTDRRLAGRIND